MNLSASGRRDRARGWEEASIQDLQLAMGQGEVTSRELTLWYLERIAMMDRSGPRLNSVAEVNPDALFLAQALDAERAVSGPCGSLHGIPVLLKDNVDTGDRMHTTAGSLALADSHAKKDAFVAKRLREAGAVILGKANLTEWANFMSHNMPNGYSSRGGQVKNPYGPGTLDVGGSSSGSAAAVAANLCAVAIGTETSGSILNPANQNGIVGIKPTVGLVSRSGIIPIAYSQDTAGPLARTVADAALVLDVIAGHDPQDAATEVLRHQPAPSFQSALSEGALAGARIGVVGSFAKGLPDDVMMIFNRAIDALRERGAVVIDDVELACAADPWDGSVLLYEFKSALNAYLSRLPEGARVRSLEDVIAFNRANGPRALLYGQEVLLQSQATSGTLTDVKYIEARLRDLRRTQREGIDASLAQHQLDCLLFPSYYGCHIAAKAGYPSVTVPAGFSEQGEPFGVTFTGTAFREHQLIGFAYAYEQVAKARRRPEFSATT